MFSIWVNKSSANIDLRNENMHNPAILAEIEGYIADGSYPRQRMNNQGLFPWKAA
jgi:hypothetical protein